eukprot:5957097-Prymnesium_polylepis.1
MIDTADVSTAVVFHRSPVLRLADAQPSSRGSLEVSGLVVGQDYSFAVRLKSKSTGAWSDLSPFSKTATNAVPQGKCSGMAGATVATSLNAVDKGLPISSARGAAGSLSDVSITSAVGIVFAAAGLAACLIAVSRQLGTKMLTPAEQSGQHQALRTFDVDDDQADRVDHADHTGARGIEFDLSDDDDD